MPFTFGGNLVRKSVTGLLKVDPAHPKTANFLASSVSHLGSLKYDPSLPPWLSSGVVYQLPQSWILGFTDLPSAIRYMIDVYRYEGSTQLWRGYIGPGLTPEFTINDVFSVLTSVDSKPTQFVWFNRNALPYASFIMKTNFGFQTSATAGPLIPAVELPQLSVDSTLGNTTITLQYVQYVPDVNIQSGNSGWLLWP